MPNKLSKQEEEHNKLVAIARQIHRDMAAKFGVPMTSVSMTAHVAESGNIELTCTVHRKIKKYESNKNSIE